MESPPGCWVQFHLVALYCFCFIDEERTLKQRFRVCLCLSSDRLTLWWGLVQEVSVWSHVKQQPNVSQRIKQLLRPKTWSSCEWPSSCLCVCDCCVGGPCWLSSGSCVHKRVCVSVCAGPHFLFVQNQTVSTERQCLYWKQLPVQTCRSFSATQLMLMPQ